MAFVLSIVDRTHELDYWYIDSAFGGHIGGSLVQGGLAVIVAEKVKLSEDGSSIDFVQSDNLPASMKKFRQSPEIEGFYRFIYENDLQTEAHTILDQIIERRKALRPAKGKAAKKAK
jgi:hypothetical protein